MKDLLRFLRRLSSSRVCGVSHGALNPSAPKRIEFTCDIVC